jgi:hypothetical protein
MDKLINAYFVIEQRPVRNKIRLINFGADNRYRRNGKYCRCITFFERQISFA